jgi:predicted dehydrogenase
LFVRMATSLLRIGVVGAGANTKLRHLPGLLAEPDVQLVAVANRSLESARRVASEFGFARVATDWREIVAADDIDAVVIGTWPNLHAEVTCAALAAGKHVLTEARMARDVAEAEAMVAAAHARPELVAQIVPAPMSLDFDATIAERVAAGEIGELREACVVHTGAQCADATAPLTWRMDRELSGTNTLTMGIYYEMLRRWLGTDPQWVQADAALFTRERPGGTAGIPESVSVLGRYTSGARLVAHFSGVEPGTPRNEFRLNGSRGSLRLDLSQGALWQAGLRGPEGLVVVPASARRGWRVEADFVASIRTGAPVRLTDFDTGLRYMRLTEAVWRSWNTEGARTALD